MAGKPEIVRALEGLPQDSLKEVKKFIDSLKKSNGKKHASGRNVELVTKKTDFCHQKVGGQDANGRILWTRTRRRLV